LDKKVSIGGKKTILLIQNQLAERYVGKTKWNFKLHLKIASQTAKKCYKLWVPHKLSNLLGV